MAPLCVLRKSRPVPLDAHVDDIVDTCGADGAERPVPGAPSGREVRGNENDRREGEGREHVGSPEALPEGVHPDEAHAGGGEGTRHVEVPGRPVRIGGHDVHRQTEPGDPVVAMADRESGTLDEICGKDMGSLPRWRTERCVHVAHGPGGRAPPREARAGSGATSGELAIEAVLCDREVGGVRVVARVTPPGPVPRRPRCSPSRGTGRARGRLETCRARSGVAAARRGTAPDDRSAGADSGAIRQRSSVASRNSSVETEGWWGRPLAARSSMSTARSKRPLEAMRTRSVTSRRTGFVGDRYEPQAHDPDAPSAFTHTTSPRSRRPQLVVENASDVAGEGTVRLPPEVRDVDRDPATRFEDPDALGEDVV